VARPDDEAVALDEVGLGNARKAILDRLGAPGSDEQDDDRYCLQDPLLLNPARIMT
jgi:hypothetical protein